MSAAGHAGATDSNGSGSGSSCAIPTLETLLRQLASAVAHHSASSGPMTSFQLLELPDDEHAPGGDAAALQQGSTHKNHASSSASDATIVQALLSEFRAEFIQRIELCSSINSTLQASVLAFLLLPNSSSDPSQVPLFPPSEMRLSRVVQTADATAMTHAIDSGTWPSEPNPGGHDLPSLPTAPPPRCSSSSTTLPDIWSDASASAACFSHLATQLPWLRSHPASAGSVLVALECSLGVHPERPAQLDLPPSRQLRPKPSSPESAEVLLLELLLPALTAFQTTAAPTPSLANTAARRRSSSLVLLALRCAMAAVSSGRLPPSLLQRCLGEGPLQEALSACVASPDHIPCRLQVRGKTCKPRM